MYENMSYETILERMLERVQTADTTIDIREGSVIYNALAPEAMEIMGMYLEAERIFNETYADTASRDFLIKRAKERGIIPQEATSAILKGEFTPTDLEIPLGSRFSLENLNYKVVEKIADGQYQMECEAPGTDGNSHFGSLIPIDYIDGLATAKLTELLIPGEDDESTESIRNRYYQTLSAESYGGNKQDYKEKVSLMQGVGGVKVYSANEWNGGGTVKIVFTDSNYDVPSKTLIEAIQEEIDPITHQGEGIGIAPIGHVVTVVGVNKATVDISANITYQPGYAWEDVVISVQNAIDEYLHGLNTVWENEKNIVVRISQIETRLLSVTGILDVTGTKLNGIEENLTVEKDSIIKRGEVTNG